MERQFIGVAKGIAYAIVWLAALVVLIRGVVGPLWGSASDLGLVGAVLAGVGGVFVLVIIAPRLIKDVAKHFNA